MTTGRPGPSGALPRSSSVLAVCAHPDDESFGLGAVLHHFTLVGASVSVLCFTHGEASTLGGSLRSLAEVRRAELGEAAQVLGVDRVALLDHPDGGLAEVPLDELAGEVAAVAAEVGADLLLVFDEGGVTGHPDHMRATEAALAAAPERPVLAWTLPASVADTLNAELHGGFVGREESKVDLVLEVDRAAQHSAISCHESQANDNPVLRRRLELLGSRESLRWLRAPSLDPETPAGAVGGLDGAAPDDRHAALAQEWDRRYAASQRVFRAEPDETLVELVSPLAPGRAADLGAGEGRNSLWLARAGWRVVAVDASAVGLSRLSDVATSDGVEVETVVGDLLGYLEGVRATGSPFDLVVLAYVHPEPDERERLLAGAAAALLPGGHLFVVGHHVSSLGISGPPDPARLYAEDDLRQVPGVEVLRLELRRGSSDVAEAGADLVLWARRS